VPTSSLPRTDGSKTSFIQFSTQSVPSSKAAKPSSACLLGNICKAASQELQSPPSNERISFRHAFLSSLQDKTAFAITSCFEASVKQCHMALFPNSPISISAEDVSQDNPPTTVHDDLHDPLQSQQNSLNDTHPLARIASFPTLPPHATNSSLLSTSHPLPPVAPSPTSNHSMRLRTRSSSLPPSFDAAPSSLNVQSVKAFFESQRRLPRRKGCGLGGSWGKLGVGGCVFLVLCACFLFSK
jgi:hypothetical protein